MSKTILCVDDDPDDIEIISEAIKSVDRSIDIIQASNGFEGMQLLSKLKESEELPDLIFLERYMPVWDGIEFVSKIKNVKELAVIPIVVFTTGISDSDKDYFARWHIAVYSKMNEFKGLRSEVKNILSRHIPQLLIMAYNLICCY